MEAPFLNTIFASNALPSGLLPCIPSLSLLGTPSSSPPLPSRPDLDLSSGNSLLSTLVAILVRSLAMPRSERPYSPGRYGENGVWEEAEYLERCCCGGGSVTKAGGSL